MRRILLALFLATVMGANAQNLVLGTKLELNTLDPHFFSAFPTNSSMEYFFDKLVDYDAALRIRPSLATSWKVIDERPWEFQRRRGVRFHDGGSFTADDVIFTVERIPNVPNSP